MMCECKGSGASVTPIDRFETSYYDKDGNDIILRHEIGGLDACPNCAALAEADYQCPDEIEDEIIPHNVLALRRIS